MSSAGIGGTPPNTYDVDSAFSFSLSTVACTGVSSSAVPAATTTAGTTVTVTGTATGCPNPQYEFWLKLPNGAWTGAQGWSSSNSFTWKTTGWTAGAYLFAVWARDASSSGTSGTSPYTYDSVSALPYTLTTTQCTGITASGAPANSTTIRTAVPVTGNATGCPAPQYEFWLKLPNGSWMGAQGWSSGNSFTWKTSGWAAGAYLFAVWARDASSSGTSGTPPYTYDTVTTVAYTLTSAPCTGVNASAVPASTASRGTTVTVSGNATGCPAAQYEFWLKLPNGSWTLVQPWSGSNTFTWSNTASYPAGSYLFAVWARDVSSTGTNGTAPYTFDALSAFQYALS